MSPSSSPAERRRHRTAAQGLAGDRPADAVDAVRRVLAVQSQDVRAARLAIRARTTGLTRDDVDKAYADGALVRTWAMRGTLHALAAEDVGWVVGLLGPRFAHANRGRRSALGLTEDICDRGAEVIASACATPRTRAQLVDTLREAGVELDPRSQAVPHLIAYTAMTGAVVRGPDVTDKEPTYVRATPAPLDEGAALARLAQRYLDGHAHATAEDLAAWSGLPLTKARAAFATATPPEPTDPGPSTRLLSHFDDYLLGHADRELVVPQRLSELITRGGMVMPVVLVDGEVVGTWTFLSADVVEVDWTAMRGDREPLRAEVADLARFIGAPVSLRE
ncbi:winged helix DNA-binding domain-containing protein [Actinokineospora soli]|uniref:Winged helix DNA-binding domain-containing protein n=1 Tax=Actinokineospora soli TaxID=1048753 RepID=A0ABW2TWX1_9PSEU